MLLVHEELKANEDHLLVNNIYLYIHNMYICTCMCTDFNSGNTRFTWPTFNKRNSRGNCKLCCYIDYLLILYQFHRVILESLVLMVAKVTLD